MATVAYEEVPQPYSGSGVRLIKWPGLAQGDDGKPYIGSWLPDKSVHVKGTFGVGGTVIVEGSNEQDPVSYASLSDPQGNPLSLNTEKIEAILENVYNIRPRVSAGDGTTSLDVYLLLVRG